MESYNKIFTILLAGSFFAFSTSGFCATTANPAGKTLKATAEDFRQEYINKDWWDKFHDPILKGYILKAIKDNYDLKIATLRVEEARAGVQEYFGKELPDVGLSVGYTRARASKTIYTAQNASSATRSSYFFPITASYELDLWGKNHDATRMKKKELEAAKHDEKAIYISLCSTIAAVYFDVLSADKQIEIQKDIVSIRKTIYEMTQENNKQGLSPTTDVLLADKALTEAESGLKDLQKSQSMLLNQLAVLVGDSSEDSASLKRAEIDDVKLINDLPKTIKSDVVKQRPDILRAEADLQRAGIDATLARKDFLPDFPIIGQIGFNAGSLAKSFNSGSYIASVSAGLVQSLFAGGQKMAVLKGKKYKYQELLDNYQKTILTSFQEVNDSLAGLKFDTEKNKDNIKRLNLENENLDIVNTQYTAGAISLLDLNRYREQVYSLEKEQIQSKTDCLIDSLSLYKAVGGKV